MLFDASFFQRNQKRLLQIANSRWLRWVLGLNRLPKALKDWKIEKITPSSIHRRIVNGKTFKVEHQAVCFTRPRFGEALAFNLSPFVYFQGMKRWQFSPVGAVGMASLWFLIRKGLDAPWYALPIFGTTSSYPATSGDGHVSHQAASWASVHGSATGTSVDYTGTTCQLLTWTNGSTWQIFRAFFAFDTSGIDDDATISAASFHLDAKPLASAYTDDMCLVSSSQASTTELATSDYDNVTTTEWASRKAGTEAVWPDGTVSQWDLNATGIAGIAKTGNTLFAVRTALDVDNPASLPSNNARGLVIKTSETTGTDHDPYLSVTYTSVVAPTVTTQAVSDITPTSATGNGNITVTGGENCTRRGFCYMAGTSGDPTVADSVAYDDGDFEAGAFTKSITGLSSATAYRVRAYAVNSAGTSYGSTVQMKTDDVVSVTKDATYKVRAEIAPATKSSAYKVRAKVSTTKGSAYVVRSSPTEEVASSYRVRVEVAPDEIASSYAVAVPTSQTKDASYAVRAEVTEEVGSVYAIRGKTAEEIASVYAVRSDVATEVLSAYAIRSDAVIEIPSSYAIRTTEQAQEKDASYTVRASATDEVGSAYAVRGKVNEEVTSTYSVRGMVSEEVGSAYAIRATQEAQEKSAAYVIRYPVSEEIEAGYSVRGSIADQIDSTYAIKSSVSDQIESVYAVRIEIVPEEKASEYGIRSSAEVHVSAQYTIHGSITQEVPSAYGILTSATATVSSSYAILTAHVQTVSSAYEIRACPNSKKVTPYSEKASPFGKKTSPYNPIPC